VALQNQRHALDRLLRPAFAAFSQPLLYEPFAAPRARYALAGVAFAASIVFSRSQLAACAKIHARVNFPTPGDQKKEARGNALASQRAAQRCHDYVRCREIQKRA